MEKKTTKRTWKYHLLNNVSYNWYGKYCSVNFYPDDLMLQGEAMEMKKEFDWEDLVDFIASKRWLES